MGKGGKAEVCGSQKSKQGFTWDEIKVHNTKEDRWVVIDDEVYDITQWSKRHPGGPRVIGHYAGQDATFAFRSFHNDLDHVKKYLKPIHLGYVLEKERKNLQIDADFKELRKTAEKMGLFKPSQWFFSLSLAHILLIEIAIVPVMLYLGAGWTQFFVAMLMETIVQGQAGWLQHDYGHLSVFKSTKWNHFLHHFCAEILKGIPRSWWNHMHYQHHAKPNVMAKDPDVRVDALFVVGDVMPVEIAKKRKKSMPYNYQDKYFFALGPPALFPLYFQVVCFMHAFTRKLWFELVLMLTCYARFFITYVPFFGLGWALVWYFSMRCLESQWFTWVAQSNHIPMIIKNDEALPWVPLQLNATCDIEKSFFNDWFTGHLNFQIEHHLFPTMPRHNYYKIAPLVRSLCEKHGIKYEVKPLFRAFIDIVKTLTKSGQLWEVTYKAYHLH